jgi:lysozyme
MMQVSQPYATVLSKLEAIAGGVPGRPGAYTWYYDNIGVATAGYGHALVDSAGNHIRRGEDAADARARAAMGALGFADNTMTMAQAIALKLADLNGFAVHVSPLVRGDTTQAQFDALTDFAYNCGVGNLQGSSLLRLHNAKQGEIAESIQTLRDRSVAKQPINSIGEAFAAYSNADHVWTLGVFHRRMFEYGIYCGADYDSAYSTAFAFRG